MALVVAASACASPAAGLAKAPPPPPPTVCAHATVTPKALRIDGVLGVAESFAGSLRLTGNHAKSQPFLLASDLVATGSIERRIDADQVTIANLEAPLAEGQSRDVVVTVKGARFAGEYKGTIVGAGGGCQIPYTLVVSGGAEVSLVGSADKALDLQMVTCRDGACGPWGGLEGLTRATSRRDEFSPLVDNGSQSPALVTGVQIALSRDPGGEGLAAGALVPSAQEFELPAQQASTLKPIDVDRDQLAPGHYNGAIYLTVTGADKRVVLPLELDVKDGPFCAVLLLLAALFVQFLVWLAARNKPRKQELDEVRVLRRKARGMPADDARLLEARFETARNLALDGKLDAAKAARATIERDIGWLAEARKLVAGIEAPGRPLPESVATALAEFRRAVEQDDTVATKVARTKLSGAVAKVKEERAAALTVPMAETAGIQGPAGVQALDVGSSGVSLRPLWDWFWGLIGPPFRAAGRGIVWASIYLLPWLLRGLLVFAFVLAGLKELYLDNSTFGADPVFSYSGLFLWGLSATAVNTALGKVIPGAGSS